MQLGLYEWVYLLTSIFGTYILYRFMAVFFDTRKTSVKTEFLSYLAYFVIVNSIYLFLHIPFVTMMANLTAFFLLSFNYESTIKKRILSAILIYIILMIVEMFVVLLGGCINFALFEVNNYSSVIGTIAINIVSYLAVLIINNFQNIKKGKYIPNSYWLCIFLVPAGSLYTIIILFNTRGLTVSQILAALILIFFINIVSFHLYDVISRFLIRKDAKFIENMYCDRQKMQIKYEKGGLK